MTDTIADMLTRIRNAQAVRKAEVLLPYSKLKLSIAEVMHKEGYVGTVEKVEANSHGSAFPQIKISLKYSKEKVPAITKIERVSKPGRRVYATKEQLPKVLNNVGIAIVSTSQGIMTNKQAKNLGVGGEVLCQMY